MLLAGICVWCLPVGTFAEDRSDDKESDPAVTLKVPKETLTEAQRRDVWTFRFQGNQQFSDEALRRALMNDGEVQELVWPLNVQNEESWPADTRADFHRTVIARLSASYRYAGYCNVAIESIEEAQDQPPVFRITEGPRFKAAVPIVNGVDKQLKEHVIRQLTEVTEDRVAGRFIEHPWWKVGSPADVAPLAQIAIQGYVGRVLRDDGYEFAEVKVSQEPDVATHQVHLRIDILPNRRILIDDIQIHGNSEYSAGQILKLTGAKAGVAATRSECERIEQALLNTGRFLHSRAWTDPPFDANDNVALHIEVREYHGIAATNDPSPTQESVLRLADWVNHWPNSGEDLSFRGFVDLQPNPLTGTADLKKFLSSGEAEGLSPASNLDDPIRNAIIAMLPLSLLPEGRLEYDAVISPGSGSLVNLKLQFSDQVVVDLASLCTNETEGILSFRSQKCWIRRHDGQPSFQPGRLQFLLNGARFGVALNLRVPDQILAGDDPTSTVFNAGRDKNASVASHGLVHVDVVAAALLRVIESSFGSLRDKSPVEKNHVTLQKDANQLSFDATSGKLLSARRSTESFELTVQPAPGRLKTELARLLKQSDAWTNAFNSKRVKGSLIQFVANEAAATYAATEMPIQLFAARVLQDSNTANVAANSVEKLQRLSVGSTPQNFFQGADTTAIGMFRAMQVVTPTSSALHRWLAAAETVEHRKALSPIYARYMDAVTDESAGPLDCLLAASIYKRWFGSSSPRGIAALLLFGERRLSKERFIANVEEWLAEDCAAGQIVRRAIDVLREYSDEDFETLCEAITVRPDNISAMSVILHTADASKRLASIRQQPEQSASDILHTELANAFDESLEEKLRNYFLDRLPKSKPAGSFILSGQSKDTDSKLKKRESRRDKILKRLSPLELPDI